MEIDRDTAISAANQLYLAACGEERLRELAVNDVYRYIESCPDTSAQDVLRHVEGTGFTHAFPVVGGFLLTKGFPNPEQLKSDIRILGLEPR